jgi:5-methylcytosine-specific restriction enzyme subunit McrC
VITIAEDDRSGVEVALDSALAEQLRKSELVRVDHTAIPGRYHLFPRSNRVGAVRVGDVNVEVRPKVSIDRLLFMLGYAKDPGFRPEDVEGTPKEDLWPAVAETLCRHAERAVGPGVLQGYVTEDAALPLVRGRIRVADQIARHPGMLLPAEVRYDAYSVDTAENRILRSALRRMLDVPRVHPTTAARLRHLDARLEGATPLGVGAPLPPWHPTRLNARYHPALRLAALVLHHQSFEVGPGGLPIAAFVVHMDKLFENFVGTALREAWAACPGQTELQHWADFDDSGVMRINVDVVHFVGGVPRIVADAKYKLESSTGRYRNPDHYQMLAYCNALHVPAAWLVYASGPQGPITRHVRNTDIDLVEYPLRLGEPPSSLLAQIADLAQSAWQRCIDNSPFNAVVL